MPKMLLPLPCGLEPGWCGNGRAGAIVWMSGLMD